MTKKERFIFATVISQTSFDHFRLTFHEESAFQFIHMHIPLRLSFPCVFMTHECIATTVELNAYDPITSTSRGKDLNKLSFEYP